MKQPSTTLCVRCQHCGWLSVIVALSIPITTSAAKVFLPKHDNEVLEVLPSTLLASRNELTLLRRQLAADVDNAELASSVASRYLQLGSQEGDPRYYGYARSALRPWWKATSPHPEILLLRAKLKEKAHNYDQALADLDLLIGQHPRHVQAWVERVNIYRVQGKYAEALDACDALSPFAGRARTLICRAPIQALTGQAEAAYDAITQILPEANQRWPSAVQWMITMQAKIAWSLGRDEQAEQHFLEGLANSHDVLFLIRDYADFLLDRGRDQEALSLLRDQTSDNGILLRAAIAARRLGEKALADDWQMQLENRFEEIRLRGSQPHGRFEARYALELKNDPQLALRLALVNWQNQKETRDSRNVLEAAIAANDPTAAEPVLKFLTQHDCEDVMLRKLAQRLEPNE